MMHVTLADTAITVTGWKPEYNEIGKYVLKVRKTPEEMKLERDAKRTLYGKNVRINPIKHIPGTVLFIKTESPDVVRFLPGFWPRVKAFLDAHKEVYEIEDKRNQAIRPQIDYSLLEGVEFRENQDVALALVATSDCGIIETTTGWGKTHLISIICKVFPTLNILICTSSTTVVSTACEYINKILPGQVGQLTGVRDTTAGKRIVVSTLRSLPKISPENVHLVLIDECFVALVKESELLELPTPGR